MKRLVLVVHGVGDQGPGETLENFASSVTENVAATIDSETVLMREDYPHHDPRKLASFACPIYRLTEPSGDQTQLAEVHWADLSKGPKGSLSTVIELISTVLGLGYLVRANVREVHESGHKPAWQIRLADLFVLLAHGPNLALNAILALGVTMTFALFQYAPKELVSFDQPFWGHIIILAASVLFLILGRMSRPPNRLRRQFADSLWAVGLLGILSTMVIGSAHWFGMISGPTEVFDTYIQLIVHAMQTTWLIMFVIAGALVLFGRSSKSPQPKSGIARIIYPQTMAAMVVTWLMFSNVFWVTLGRWTAGNAQVKSLMDVHLLNALALLSVVVGAFVVLVIAILILVYWRAKWIARFRAEHTSPAAHAANPIDPQPDMRPSSATVYGRAVPRLLLNRPLGDCLVVLLLIMFAAALYLFADRFLLAEMHLPDHFYIQANQIAAYVSAALGAGIVLFWPFLKGPLAVGLGLGKDVINYFVDFQPHFTPPQGIKRGFANMLRGPQQEPDFLLRDRIDGRFSIVFKTLTSSYEPDEIIVVSHSQGTVISVRALSKLDGDPILERIKLVTMGSPYTHIYGHYFPRTFNFDNVPDALVKNWTNIYRVDDFVGTHVETQNLDGGIYPQNFPVLPMGHTGYWSDQHVLDIIACQTGLKFKKT